MNLFTVTVGGLPIDQLEDDNFCNTNVHALFFYIKKGLMTQDQPFLYIKTCWDL